VEGVHFLKSLKESGDIRRVTVKGQNFSSDVVATCDEEKASLDFTWMNDFYTVTLDFTAVSILGLGGLQRIWIMCCYQLIVQKNTF